MNLIFLHGWAGNAKVWKRQADFFSPHHTVFCPDLSYQEEMVHSRDWAKEILAHCKDDYVIISWSSGWLLILLLIEAGLIEPFGLVAINGFAKFISYDYIERGVRPARLRWLSVQVKKNASGAIRDFGSSLFLEEEKQEPGYREFQKTFSSRDNLDATVLLSGLGLLETLDLRRCLKKIHSPVLLIASPLDPIVPVGCSLYMKERIPGARLELLEGCGHVPMWSKAEKANQRIEEFMRGLKE